MLDDENTRLRKLEQRVGELCVLVRQDLHTTHARLRKIEGTLHGPEGGDGGLIVAVDRVKGAVARSSKAVWALGIAAGGFVIERLLSLLGFGS